MKIIIFDRIHKLVTTPTLSMELWLCIYVLVIFIGWLNLFGSAFIFYASVYGGAIILTMSIYSELVKTGYRNMDGDSWAGLILFISLFTLFHLVSITFVISTPKTIVAEHATNHCYKTSIRKVLGDDDTSTVKAYDHLSVLMNCSDANMHGKSYKEIVE